MRKYTIYPEVLVEESPQGDWCRLTSYLRKLHEGKYYLWKHKREYQFDSHMLPYERDLTKTRELQIFHDNVYRTIVLGIVNPELIIERREPLYFLDEDQTPEFERMFDYVNRWRNER